MVAKKSNSKAVVSWEEEAAREAQELAEEESGGGLARISTKSGVLNYRGVAFPNNSLQCVILDRVFLNVYYPGDYDPDNTMAPTCFAIDRKEAHLAAHDKAHEKQNDDGCETCPQNEWGSGKRGNSKACKNTRRLALVKADALDNPDALAAAKVYYLELPVTSVRYFGDYVQSLANNLKRTPKHVITEIRTVPDVKTQYAVEFRAVKPIEDDRIRVALANKVEEIKKEIETPYIWIEKEEAAPKRGGAKKAAQGRRKY